MIRKYQPGKVTALPLMMNHQASQMSLLRQLQNRTNMTRREITENRIIQNILLHNDPKELQTYSDIYISTRSATSEALLAIGQNPSMVSFQTKGAHPTLQLAGASTINGGYSSTQQIGSAIHSNHGRRQQTSSLPKILPAASQASRNNSGSLI